ncbi:hypothetical protein DJ030_17025 [bacterium endosymbiont of Escarpia laminata]|nr:MAG: hypothetical protein DJ031_18710 [bacterium endosymbiont of Escarpia laminata]RLJ16452.1 MAG: hypothetical protein DJ030_17025 [bacterium endosymbiont of Escarpia laminata]
MNMQNIITVGVAFVAVLMLLDLFSGEDEFADGSNGLEDIQQVQLQADDTPGHAPFPEIKEHQVVEMSSLEVESPAPVAKTAITDQEKISQPVSGQAVTEQVKGGESEEVSFEAYLGKVQADAEIKEIAEEAMERYKGEISELTDRFLQNGGYYNADGELVYPEGLPEEAVHKLELIQQEMSNIRESMKVRQEHLRGIKY